MTCFKGSDFDSSVCLAHRVKLTIKLLWLWTVVIEFFFLFLQKERDLELAARIGQSLLKKNKALSERNELLEEQVEHIREEVWMKMAAVCLMISLPHFVKLSSNEHSGVSAASWPVHERWAATVLHQCRWGKWGRVHHLHPVRVVLPVPSDLS